jgi:hypothetical protein
VLPHCIGVTPHRTMQRTRTAARNTTVTLEREKTTGQTAYTRVIDYNEGSAIRCRATEWRRQQNMLKDEFDHGSLLVQKITQNHDFGIKRVYYVKINY